MPSPTGRPHKPLRSPHGGIWALGLGHQPQWSDAVPGPPQGVCRPGSPAGSPWLSKPCSPSWRPRWSGMAPARSPSATSRRSPESASRQSAIHFTRPCGSGLSGSKNGASAPGGTPRTASPSPRLSGTHGCDCGGEGEGANPRTPRIQVLILKRQCSGGGLGLPRDRVRDPVQQGEIRGAKAIRARHPNR